MNPLRRIFPLALTMVVILAACGNGGQTAPSGLEPTRTASSNTPAPRATRVPTVTPIPRATDRPLVADAITLDSAAALTVTATREETSPPQLYAVANGRVLGVASRSFELLDATTLQSITRTTYSVPPPAPDESSSMYWYTASPDATTGATMNANGEVTFYDLGTGQTTKTLTLTPPENTAQADIALSADGRELVYANGVVRRFLVETGEELGVAQTMPAATARILFAENASKLAAIQPDGSIVVLDTGVTVAAAPVSPTEPLTPTEPIAPSPEVTASPEVTTTTELTSTELVTPTESVAPAVEVTPIEPVTPTVEASATVALTPSELVAPAEPITPTTEVTTTELVTPTEPVAPAPEVTASPEVTATTELTPAEAAPPAEPVSPTEPVTPTEPVAETGGVTLTPNFTSTDQLQFSPLGTWLGVADGESQVVLYNLSQTSATSETSSAPMAQTIDVTGPALTVFDAQGTRVAVLNAGVVTVYAIGAAEQPIQEQVLQLSGDAVPTSAHFSADGSTVFVASVGGVENFRVSDGGLVQSGMRLGFTRLLFTLDGQRVLSWGALTPSANVGVIDAATGEVISQLAHDSMVRFVTLSPTGQYAATVTRDGSTHVWRLSDETDLLTITAAPDNERRGAVCFTPDEKGLVMIEGDEIVIEPIGSGNRRRFALPDNVLNLAGCGNDQGTLAFIAEDEISIANLDGDILGTITLPSEATDLREAALYQFSNDGRHLAGMSGSALYVWDTGTQELLHTVNLVTPPIFGFEFSPTDAKIAVNFGDAAQLVDVATGEVTELNVPTSPTARWLTVLFTADPNTVLTAAMVSDEATADQQVTARTYVTGEITVWDATTGEAVQTFEVAEPIYAAAINADGTQIATGSQNNTLNVWKLKE